MSVYPGYRILKVLPRGEGKQVEVLCEAQAGGLDSGGEARLFPGARDLKIRSVKDRDGESLLRVKGISRSALLPGAVIVSPQLPVVEACEGLFLHDGGSLPSETEAVRGGLCNDFNRERIIGRASFGRSGSFITIRFPTAYPMVPGMECSILGPDYTPRYLTLLWPGQPSRDEIRKLENDAPRRPDPHPDSKEVFGRILFTRGYVRMPEDLLKVQWKGALQKGHWMIRESLVSNMENKIRKLASRPGGAGNKILKLEGHPDDLVHALADSMVSSGNLQTRDGWFFPPGAPPLSPYHRGWLARVEETGEEGLRGSSVKKPSDIEALEVLVRSGLILGGRDLWLAPEAFGQLTDKLLKNLSPGDQLTMADAREKLEGSRVRTLELLYILESEGRLISSPDGEGRIVV